MKELVLIPNLPTKPVCEVIYGAKYRNKLESSLRNFHISSITLPDYPFVPPAISGHVDLFCCHVADRTYVVSKSIYEPLRKLTEKEKVQILRGNDVKSPKYPDEIAYNTAIVGNCAFCSIKHTEQAILNHLIDAKLKVIDCKQGYAKCSVAVADDHSIITADEDIHRKATAQGIDSLLIEPGHIKLEGYKYGFIGGCMVKLAPDIAAFTGSLEQHPSCSKIKAFLSDRGIQIVYLTQETLFDVGSIIPYTQYTQ